MATGGIRGAVEAQLESMSPRDKKLLSGMFVFFGLVGLFILTYTLVSVRGSLEGRVRDAKSTLREVQQLQRDYDEAAAMLKAQEARLAQYPEPLSAHVETVVNNLGISDGLKDATRVEQVEENGVTSTKWRVVLKGRTYDEAINFMLALENDGYPLKIQTARFKRVLVKREPAVDLTIELTTYKVEKS